MAAGVFRNVSPVAAGVCRNVSGNVSPVAASLYAGLSCRISGAACRGGGDISAAAHNNGDIPERQRKILKTTHTNYNQTHGYMARPQKIGLALHKGLAPLSTRWTADMFFSFSGLLLAFIDLDTKIRETLKPVPDPTDKAPDDKLPHPPGKGGYCRRVLGFSAKAIIVGAIASLRPGLDRLLL